MNKINKKSNVTLMVLTLNEADGMRIIMPQVDHSLFCQILIVDGKSTDSTVEYAKVQGYDIYIQQKKGLHHAYREAWPHIKGEYVLTFSPDGNSKPEDLPVLINKIKEGFDMVIGSRYFGGAKSEDDGIITGFGNWLFTSVINLLYSVNYTDAMTIYRIYRTQLYYDLGLDNEYLYRKYERLYFTTIGVEPILSSRFAKEGLKHADVPADEPVRIGGIAKLQVIRWGLAYMTQIILDRFVPKLMNIKKNKMVNQFEFDEKN